jgi:hypothetical protein
MVDFAFFDVLLPLIKDFFWIAILIPPGCRFLIFLAASTARHGSKHGWCQTGSRRLRKGPACRINKLRNDCGWAAQAKNS